MTKKCIIVGMTIGVCVCVLVRLNYAACVLPATLTERANAIAGNAATYKTAKEANKCAFVKDLVKALPVNTTTLDGTTIGEQNTALKNRVSDWQKRVVGSNVEAARKTLTVAQSWASFGEVVIAVSPKQIAVVVPGNLGSSTTGKWKDYPIPCVAYAGDEVGSTAADYTVTAVSPMDKLFDNPTEVEFFRYRN